MTALRADMLHLEEESAAVLDAVAPACADSARNLLHYGHCAVTMFRPCQHKKRSMLRRLQLAERFPAAAAR